jgi:hypothetical protein
MKAWDVKIRATIEKTIRIEAEDMESPEDINDEDKVAELAHQIFSVNCDGNDESYEQDTVAVEESLDSE